MSHFCWLGFYPMKLLCWAFQPIRRKLSPWKCMYFMKPLFSNWISFSKDVYGRLHFEIFIFYTCSARSRILYEVGSILHKTRYVLLPGVQKHVPSHLTVALTLFFWLWTVFCPQMGQTWPTSDSYCLMLLFRPFCYNEYFRKILSK